jgi:hypothetical protein
MFIEIGIGIVKIKKGIFSVFFLFECRCHNFIQNARKKNNMTMRRLFLHTSGTETDIPFETELIFKRLLNKSHVTDLRCSAFYLVSTSTMTYDTKPFYWFYIEKVTLQTPAISLLVLQMMIAKPSSAKVPTDMVDRVLKRALILCLQSSPLSQLVMATCGLIATAAAKYST